MNALNELEEIKEFVNDNKKFKYKNIVNFNCDCIKDELEYADKCHSLEEQIGCPLEVRCSVVPDSFIYTFGTSMENQDIVTQRHVVTISKEGFTIMYAAATGKDRKMELSWKAYKKTWWLKKDKSE